MFDLFRYLCQSKLLTSGVLIGMPYYYCAQEAICASLEDYNHEIEELKRDMSDVTHGAEEIRNDINALSQRFAVVKRDESCKVSKSYVFSF